MIDRTKATAVAVGWWRSLQPDSPTADRAALARLRRCASVAEAMQDRASITLFRRCAGAGPSELPRIAMLAAVLAHVREDRPGMPVARQLGPDDPDHPETARMSVLRFRRVLEAPSSDEQLTAFRRLVAFAGGSLDVRDLAASLLDWSEERRRRWIYDYWNAGQPANESSKPAEEATS